MHNKKKEPVHLRPLLGLEKIKALSGNKRAKLVVDLLQSALARAKLIQQDAEGEKGYTLDLEVETFVERYCTFAGWGGEDGQGM